MSHLSSQQRRDFLKSLGLAVLSVQVLALAGASGDEGANVNPQETLRIKSGKSHFAPLPGHFHYLFIPLTVISNPPAEGIKLPTTWAYAHHHEVKLSAGQLAVVAQGQSVTVPDTVGDHLYAIHLSPDAEVPAGTLPSSL